MVSVKIIDPSALGSNSPSRAVFNIQALPNDIQGPLLDFVVHFQHVFPDDAQEDHLTTAEEQDDRYHGRPAFNGFTENQRLVEGIEKIKSAQQRNPQSDVQGYAKRERRERGERVHCETGHFPEAVAGFRSLSFRGGEMNDNGFESEPVDESAQKPVSLPKLKERVDDLTVHETEIRHVEADGHFGPGVHETIENRGSEPFDD